MAQKKTAGWTERARNRFGLSMSFLFSRWDIQGWRNPGPSPPCPSEENAAKYKSLRTMATVRRKILFLAHCELPSILELRA